MSRRSITVLIAVLLTVLAVFVLPTTSPFRRAHCSDTNFGHGVVCVSGTGKGGNDVNITSKTVDYAPAAGNAVIAAAYTCADRDCQQIPATTLRLGDNLHDPEPCFVASPHSPFALNETSATTQKLQEYIWVCPAVPAGVTRFTVSCSLPTACSYITVTVTEWTGLAPSDVFDTDGGAASSTRQTMATIPTSSPTSYTNVLLYTFLDNTEDRTMSPAPPHRTVLQFYPGNINTAAIAATPGIQTVTTAWDGSDDWYGAIVAIKSATSQPAAVYP